ncbi:hypothetical protein FG386_002838 [Cryptosporidium ryanae]|uniref:uncharacterized protein n=1 Tax=Cryptosporidium ryanae TaxID=515981 RepID=UPI00351A36CD|nr:hypothetical protein FG386_002838 [Cryptosporidium ryanae]
MRVTVTQELNDFLKKHGESSLCNLKKIDVDTLIKVYSKVLNKINDNVSGKTEKVNESYIPTLQELLMNSKRDFDDSNKKNNSNISIMEILRKRSEERKYQCSIKNLSQAKYTTNTSSVPDIFGVHYSRDVFMSLNAIIGLILTFIGGFYAPVYMGLSDLNTRIFIGVGCSITCLVAEVSLFMIYDVKRNMKVSKKMKEDPIYNFLEKNKGIDADKRNRAKKLDNNVKSQTRNKKGKKFKHE